MLMMTTVMTRLIITTVVAVMVMMIPQILTLILFRVPIRTSANASDEGWQGRVFGVCALSLWLRKELGVQVSRQ